MRPSWLFLRRSTKPFIWSFFLDRMKNDLDGKVNRLRHFLESFLLILDRILCHAANNILELDRAFVDWPENWNGFYGILFQRLLSPRFAVGGFRREPRLLFVVVVAKQWNKCQRQKRLGNLFFLNETMKYLSIGFLFQMEQEQIKKIHINALKRSWFTHDDSSFREKKSLICFISKSCFVTKWKTRRKKRKPQIKTWRKLRTKPKRKFHSSLWDEHASLIVLWIFFWRQM